MPVRQSRRWDSNPQPADYKSAALPIELRRHHLLLGFHLPSRTSVQIGTVPARRIFSGFSWFEGFRG
jgi:hypothetical protein